jgi:hypothetical protein
MAGYDEDFAIDNHDTNAKKRWFVIPGLVEHLMLPGPPTRNTADQEVTTSLSADEKQNILGFFSFFRHGKPCIFIR